MPGAAFRGKMVAKGSVLQKSRKKKAANLFVAGRFGEVCGLLRAYCAGPGRRDAEAWCLLAAAHGELGEYDVAIQCCQKAVELEPSYLDARYNLAQALMHQGRLEEAVEAYRAVLALEPDHADALNTLGLALESLGRLREAILCYRDAHRLNPSDAKVLLNLASLYQALGEAPDALGFIRSALAIEPENANAWLALGQALTAKGELNEASGALDQVERLGGDADLVAIGRAMIHEKRGNFADALAWIEPLLGRRPVKSEVALCFARVSRHFGRQHEAVTLLQEAVGHAGSGVGVRALYFQLGKIQDELGQYEEAFRAFREANRHSPVYVEPLQSLEVMARQRQVCDREFFERLALRGSEDDTPIFIVGMPRSGTTLTEQILSSHPEVFGAGERTFIGALVERLDKVGRQKGGYPACLGSLPEHVLRREARAYLDEVREQAGPAARITDKMPHNFLYLALVSLLFPNARVVHCRRDPMDNCLSIYTYEFNAAHPYAVDLRELGRHYRAYQALMSHWSKVLPLPIFEVCYEEMVADQERVSRELIEFCGLPWNEACLRFYKNRRVVNTFSYNQVRKPIYTKSVSRWRNYEPWLKPLREALAGIE